MCLHRRSPRYVADHLIPVSDAAPPRRRLRSANLIRLTVPRCRLSTYGCLALHYAGPAVWNLLPDELRNSENFDSFKRFLPARRYASAGLCDSDVSVCLSVCHTPVLCLAKRKQDREMYTIWYPHDSSFWEGMTRRKIRMGSPPKMVPNEGGLGFFDNFQPICRHISKTVHFRHKVTMGR